MDFARTSNLETLEGSIGRIQVRNHVVKSTQPHLVMSWTVGDILCGRIILVSLFYLPPLLSIVLVFKFGLEIEITSWKVRAYDFYSRVEKYRKTNK